MERLLQTTIRRPTFDQILIDPCRPERCGVRAGEPSLVDDVLHVGPVDTARHRPEGAPYVPIPIQYVKREAGAICGMNAVIRQERCANEEFRSFGPKRQTESSSKLEVGSVYGHSLEDAVDDENGIGLAERDPVDP